MKATISDQNLKASEPFPLLRLPLELRREIYRHHFVETPYPSAEDIYSRKISKVSRPLPSPLLRVTRQVRDEVLDLVQLLPVVLTVTDRGIQFCSWAETCFIAQPRVSSPSRRNYGSISHLVVKIWPRHPDRPTDAIDIWRHLRKLRAELCAAPRLQRITLVFTDTNVASWIHNNKPPSLLCRIGGGDDMTRIMGLFARIRAVRAAFILPGSLRPERCPRHLLNAQRMVDAMMMGRIPILKGTYSEEEDGDAKFQDWMKEKVLQRKGAEIARDKLEVMTRQGRMPLTQGDWDHFVRVWSPHFEELWPWDSEAFKRKQYYVPDRVSARLRSNKYGLS